MEIPPGAQVVRIKCFPDAGEDSIIPLGNGRFEAYVRAPAQDGRANDRLIQLFAMHLSIPRERMRILSGHQKQHKIVIINRE
jgi:uncharacterized protein